MIQAFEACNVFLLPQGEIEHYYTQTALNYLNVTNKDRLFETERDYILNCTDILEITTHYSNLISILDKAVPVVDIDLKNHLKYVIIEWIHIVQRGIERGEITDIETLKTNAKTEFNLYNQIIEVSEMRVQEDKKFKCKIKFQASLTNLGQELEFDEKTIAHDFTLD